jgi:hypothetical protein
VAVAADGRVVITPGQLTMLLEDIDWRMPQRTWQPMLAGRARHDDSGSSLSRQSTRRTSTLPACRSIPPLYLMTLMHSVSKTIQFCGLGKNQLNGQLTKPGN